MAHCIKKGKITLIWHLVVLSAQVFSFRETSGNYWIRGKYICENQLFSNVLLKIYLYYHYNQSWLMEQMLMELCTNAIKISHFCIQWQNVLPHWLHHNVWLVWYEYISSCAVKLVFAFCSLKILSYNYRKT